MFIISVYNFNKFTHNYIMYFNYHAKAKKLIIDGKLVKYEIVKNYNGISPALVLYFKNNKPIPIRQHKFEEYFELIDKISFDNDN